MPTLTLVPSKSAVSRKLAGFHQGIPLNLSFKAGETLAAILDRFNEYRNPDNQIEQVFTSGNPLPLTTVLQQDLRVEVP